MAYIDHIERCNRFDRTRFAPFLTHHHQRVGWIAKDHFELLSPYLDFLDIREDRVLIAPVSPDETTDIMDMICRDLLNRGILSGWRNEPYKVARHFYDTPAFIIERAGVAFFGIRAFGVHLNGFVRTPKGLKMWVAKRAKDRLVSPGKLDNMVAGGQPATLTLQENLIKEGFEEAGADANLMSQARPVGLIAYAMETALGLKPDVMYCYDLEVPLDFVPYNQDAECESFHLIDVEEIADIVRTTEDFKPNCNLVVIDFLIRHGIINPDTADDYEKICAGLRQL